MKEDSKKFGGFNKFKPTAFEEHIRNSIPNYESMRMLIPSIASNFITKSSNVYDIGCSTGDLLLQLEKIFRDIHNDVSYVGYDIADNLLPDMEYAPNHSFFPRDVTDHNLKMYNTSLVFSLFTLQFIHPEKRIALIKKIYQSLSKRGAFIVCEKITADNGFIEDVFTFSNYDLKRANGFFSEEILEKQYDLRPIMQTLSQEENERIFREAGFKVNVFWKSLNFIGWILVK